MTLRVAVDASALAGERSGVGRYLGHLLAHAGGQGCSFALIAGRGIFPAARRRRRAEVLQACGRFGHAVVPLLPHRPRLLMDPLYERQVLPRLLQRLQARVFFAPNYLLPQHLPAGVRGIITVHDLAFLRHPELVPPDRRQLLVRELKHSCDRAAGIVCVSQETCADLVELLGVPPDKVRVIYEGTTVPAVQEAAAERAVLRRHGILEPYILFLGNLEPRKNLVRLVRAFYQFAEPIQLVLAGSQARAYPELRRELQGKKNIVLTGYLDDRSAAALLRRALFLAYPSVYEGFGLVPLEAMACGCPVLAGRGGALPEVLGEAAEWIDPLATDDIVRGLERLWFEDAWRDELVRRGAQQAARYTWRAAAEQTLAFFRDVAAA